MPPLEIPKTKTCSICGNKFQTVYSKTLVCSDECAKKAKAIRNKRCQKSRAKHRDPIPCAICGKVFTPKSSVQRFCSESCHNKSRGESRRNNFAPRPCEFCKKDFRPTTDTQRFCSHACASEAKKNPDGKHSRIMGTRLCEYCGDEFVTRVSSTAKYCSLECGAFASNERRAEEEARAKPRYCPFAGPWKDDRDKEWPAMQTLIPGVSWSDPIMGAWDGWDSGGVWVCVETERRIAA